MNERDEHNHPIHLNLNVRGLAPSATVAINDRCNELIRRGRSITKLGLGQSPFPVPDTVVECLRQNAPQKDYLPVHGLFELRRAIAEHHCRTFDIDCTADDVLIGPGSKELMFLLQLCFYGDLVIPSPAWVSYAPQAKIIGRHIHVLPTSIENDYYPTGEQLDAFCRQDHSRPRILVLNGCRAGLELPDHHENPLEDVDGLKSSHNNRHTEPGRNRLILFPPHDRANVTGRQVTLNAVARRTQQRRHRRCSGQVESLISGRMNSALQK